MLPWPQVLSCNEQLFAAHSEVMELTEHSQCQATEIHLLGEKVFAAEEKKQDLHSTMALMQAELERARQDFRALALGREPTPHAGGHQGQPTMAKAETKLRMVQEENEILNTKLIELHAELSQGALAAQSQDVVVEMLATTEEEKEKCKHMLTDAQVTNTELSEALDRTRQLLRDANGKCCMMADLQHTNESLITTLRAELEALREVTQQGDTALKEQQDRTALKELKDSVTLLQTKLECAQSQESALRVGLEQREAQLHSITRELSQTRSKQGAEGDRLRAEVEQLKAAVATAQQEREEAIAVQAAADKERAGANDALRELEKAERTLAEVSGNAGAVDAAARVAEAAEEGLRKEEEQEANDADTVRKETEAHSAQMKCKDLEQHNAELSAAFESCRRDLEVVNVTRRELQGANTELKQKLRDLNAETLVQEIEETEEIEEIEETEEASRIALVTATTELHAGEALGNVHNAQTALGEPVAEDDNSNSNGSRGRHKEATQAADPELGGDQGCELKAVQEQVVLLKQAHMDAEEKNAQLSQKCAQLNEELLTAQRDLLGLRAEGAGSEGPPEDREALEAKNTKLQAMIVHMREEMSAVTQTKVTAAEQADEGGGRVLEIDEWVEKLKEAETKNEAMKVKTADMREEWEEANRKVFLYLVGEGSRPVCLLPLVS